MLREDMDYNDRFRMIVKEFGRKIVIGWNAEPTLRFGSFVTAYVVPLSAMKRARSATAIEGVGRVRPHRLRSFCPVLLNATPFARS